MPGILDPALPYLLSRFISAASTSSSSIPLFKAFYIPETAATTSSTTRLITHKRKIIWTHRIIPCCLFPLLPDGRQRRRWQLVVRGEPPRQPVPYTARAGHTATQPIGVSLRREGVGVDGNLLLFARGLRPTIEVGHDLSA